MENPDNKYSFEFRHDLQRAFSSEDIVRAFQRAQPNNKAPDSTYTSGGFTLNNALAEVFVAIFKKSLFITFERYLVFPSFLSHSPGILSTCAPASVRIFLKRQDSTQGNIVECFLQFSSRCEIKEQGFLQQGVWWKCQVQPFWEE